MRTLLYSAGQSLPACLQSLRDKWVDDEIKASQQPENFLKKVELLNARRVSCFTVENC